MTFMVNRLASLAEAASTIRNGQTLALGGAMNFRRPVAFVRALLARATPPADLTLLTFTAGYESDLLVGGGCLARIRTCYFGLGEFGLAPMFTLAATAGTVEIVEETEASLALGIRAALGGVGFMPSRAWLGTDLLVLRPDVRLVKDPYSGETLVAFPAIPCDVTVIHALVADRQGNARLNKNLGIDRELAFLADTVIVTAETLVDRLTEDVDIAAPLTSMVVQSPQGAWPTSCYPDYAIDGDELLRYTEACAAGDFARYLESLASQPEST